MNLKEVKQVLENANSLSFELPNGQMVPSHFHLTELGVSTKQFVDCGGKLREDKKISIQLYFEEADDHVLAPTKLLKIIADTEKRLPLDENLEVEVEYQAETLGKYLLGYNGNHFTLSTTYTDCLAKEACNIPEPQAVCTPGGGCC